MIKIIQTYYCEDVTIEDIKKMTPVSPNNHDTLNDVYKLPNGTVLRTTNDGRYYDIGTKEEWCCIVAQEYDDDGESIEGVTLGFVKK